MYNNSTENMYGEFNENMYVECPRNLNISTEFNWEHIRGWQQNNATEAASN